jgi:alkaline phosphatase D
VDALAASSVPFKVIVFGSQVLNRAAVLENYSSYPGERESLLRAIEQQRIPGVVFLSGERHHTELTRMPRHGTYPVYDLRVSPLTAGVSKAGENPGNAWRVRGTYVAERTFATLAVRGPRTARELVITVRNADGQERWTRTIKALALR